MTAHDHPTNIYDPPRPSFGWRVRLAWWLIHFGCRHPQGMVCRHRLWDYDHYYYGLLDGLDAGVAQERRHEATR